MELIFIYKLDYTKGMHNRMRQVRDGKNHMRVLITIDAELLDIMDKKREWIPRSVFIEQILVHALPRMVEDDLSLQEGLKLMDKALSNIQNNKI